MSITDFLSKLEPGRKETISSLHKIIQHSDKTVQASIGYMMGKEMIRYHADGVFKYGLSSVKHYMSLHTMPIYGSSKLYEKYTGLLTKANFQKGCINFKNTDEMPLAIFSDLIADSSKVDIAAIRDNYQKQQKAAKDKKPIKK